MNQLHRYDQSGICPICTSLTPINFVNQSFANGRLEQLQTNSLSFFNHMLLPKMAPYPNGRLMFLLYRHELDINHKPSTPFLVGSRYRYRSWHFEESNSRDAVAWKKTTQSVVIDLPLNGQCQHQMCQQLASNYTTIVLYCTIRTRDMIHNTPQVIVSSKVSKRCYKVAEPNSVDDR